MQKPSAALTGAGLIGVACLAVLVVTSPMLPMAWDEGNAIQRAEGIRRWVARFAESWREPLSKQALEADWQYTTRIEGHPAFYGVVIAAGEWLSQGLLTPLNQARFGPMTLFSFAVAAVTYRLWRMKSPAAGLAAAAALLTLPRLFAHAHFASFDGPLTSCWLLTWATFDPARRDARWTIAWGAALGATLSCKFTGWFAPLPFVFWVAAFGDRRAARALAIGLTLAAITFWALNPPLWRQPLTGLESFLEMSLARAEHGHNVPTMYFGSRYDMMRPLPWHNTLVWTVITVPLGTLALFALGVRRAAASWRARPEWLLLIGNWAVLVVVRATPWAPPHDAERLFLPSFAFLALLAGLGVDELWGAARRLGRWAVVAALAGGLTSSAWYAPQWLSYYNLLVGGVRGATALGMEPTYYWDGFDADVLTWLAQHTAADQKIAFGASSYENWECMRRWGNLPAACLPGDPGRFRWYVIQRRPSMLSTADRLLLTHAKPAFRKTIRSADMGWGPWRLDVPIVEVYDYADFTRFEPGAAAP